MANVYIEARPKGRPESSPIEDYIVEDYSDHVLATDAARSDRLGDKKWSHALVAWGRPADRRFPPPGPSANDRRAYFLARVSEMKPRERPPASPPNDGWATLTAHWGATPCIKIVRTMG
jgi:hypothetical protein